MSADYATKPCPDCKKTIEIGTSGAWWHARIEDARECYRTTRSVFRTMQQSEKTQR